MKSEIENFQEIVYGAKAPASCGDFEFRGHKLKACVCNIYPLWQNPVSGEWLSWCDLKSKVIEKES